MSQMGQMIRESTARLFRSEGTLDRTGFADEWPEALWTKVEEAGLPHALVDTLADPEVQAGDVLAAVRTAAEHAAPVPLAETMIAAWLLVRHRIRVPTGLALSLAPVTTADRLTWIRTSEGWRISGLACRVPWGRHVDAIAVVAPVAGSGQSRLGLVEKSGWSAQGGHNIADEPRDDLTLDAIVPEDRCAEVTETSPTQVRLAGAAMRTIQIAGAASAVLSVTARYASERVQFGRPIAQFQAVQHNLAVLASQTAAASVAADVAAESIAGGLDTMRVAAAKARAGEAASIIASQAHQIHGAMGFTAEYRLNRLTRRLWSWRDEFGSEAEWNRRVGMEIAKGGADNIWATLTAV